MKKALLLIIMVALSSIVADARTVEFTYRGVSFKAKQKGGTLCIESFDQKVTKVKIPSEVTAGGTHYKVTSIDLFSVGKFYYAEEVEIEQGVETIEKYCFLNFRKLREVTLPYSINYVGKAAFNDNNSLAFNLPLSIPESLLRSRRAFYADIAYDPSADNAGGERKEKKKREERQQALGGVPIINSQKDVDHNIPYVNTRSNTDTYCVIIANENYDEIPAAEFAINDGTTLRTYMTQVLGVPEKQIKMYTDASYTEMVRSFKWMEDMSTLTQGKAKFIFYYSGHGIPSEKDKTAYFIPTDGFPNELSTCFNAQDLYTRFGNLNAKSVTVLLDACFSGMRRGSENAVLAARGVAIKPKRNRLTGNVVVFSAASNDETAMAYRDMQHGMFTYHLLSQLKHAKGDINFGRLVEAVRQNVERSSIFENNKLQTPSVEVSDAMKDKWQGITF